uniref:Uncharacterized protein n=1 Tax=Desulfobacca acetoxidans TaxID=60893 RepID=A0A7V4G8W5_9BACT
MFRLETHSFPSSAWRPRGFPTGLLLARGLVGVGEASFGTLAMASPLGRSGLGLVAAWPLALAVIMSSVPPSTFPA